MAHRALTRGTPLRTLALLLSHRQDLIYEASLAATAAAGGVLSPTATAGPGPTPPGSAGALKPSGGSTVAAMAAGGGLFSPTGGSGAYGFFSPSSAGPQGDPLLTHWRENLAMMAANRTAGGVEAMMRLGDLLLAQQGQVSKTASEAPS